MNNIINEMITIEEHACIRINDAKIAADEMVRNAVADSQKRIESIKRKASEQINEIDMQNKAQADALIEAQAVDYQKKADALGNVFDKYSDKISNEIFEDIIGEY
ncbi:MAG: hypothetical protein IJO29_03955 [Oscillospiraceae bacterium]|nr:hypothetical protein [Oscillospiraceae bacterium]